MSFAAEVMAKIQGYLDAVRANLGNRPEPVRAELLRQLESHICEALRKRGGDTPSSADAEAVLAEMDAPEKYGKETQNAEFRTWNLEDGTPGAECGAVGGRAGCDRPPNWLWFSLALCFLLLNSWGIWKLTSLASARGGAGSAHSGGGAAKIAEAAKKADANTPLTAELVSANELSGQQCIVWRFSREMVPAADVGKVLVDHAPTVRDGDNDTVYGSALWRSASELQFMPGGEWCGGADDPDCRRFTAELPAELRSLDGKTLTGRRQFQFRTPALYLVSAAQTGRTELGEPVLKLSFNMVPDAKTLEKFITVTSGDGQRAIAWRQVGDVKSRDVILRLSEEEP
jgi:hypothetical protein